MLDKSFSFYLPYNIVYLGVMRTTKKMDELKRRKRFDFIPQELYEKLDDEVRKNLEDYREKYRLTVLKQKRIETLKTNLKEQRDLLRVMKRELTHSISDIIHLKKDFMFNCSVVSFEVKNRNNTYFNLLISRNSHKTKSCSLGNEETVKEHLLTYYKDNRKVIKEIKSDWKGFLKVESNWGNTYTRIMKMIMDNPLGFKNETINRHTLFPINQTKRK